MFWTEYVKISPCGAEVSTLGFQPRDHGALPCRDTNMPDDILFYRSTGSISVSFNGRTTLSYGVNPGSNPGAETN